MHTTASFAVRPQPTPARWTLRASALVLALALVPAWLAVLRPVSLGGPAGYTIVAGPSMRPALDSGDLVVTRRQESYGIGDVVVYEVPSGEPGAGAHVIHRIVGGSARSGYVTQGDNRDGADPWRIVPADIEGTVRLTVPRGGDGLLLLRTPLGLALLAGLVTLVVLLAAMRPARDPS